jgi:mevalonate kinase
VVSSPAKVIICGEHSVVYGEDALAMAINLRCCATVWVGGLGCSLPPIIIFGGCISCEVDVNSIDRENRLEFREFVNANKLVEGSCEEATKLRFKIGVFFRETGLKLGDVSRFRVQLESEIPVGKCLGSSASFNTVLVACLFVMVHCGEPSPPPLDLLEVNRISKLFERVEHGNPSGVDNYLSTFGGVVLYNNSKSPPFTAVRDPETLRKLATGVRFRLVDSGVKKNTERAVGVVRQNY